MMYLPRNLAALAKCASKGDGCYSMQGIHLVDLHGGYRAEATDGKKAVIVRQENPVPAQEEQYAQQLAGADNGATEGLIETAAWTDLLKMKPITLGRQELPVAVVLDKFNFTAATPEATRSGQLVDGRFPTIDNVIPRKPALLSLCVDPRILTDLLSVPIALGCEAVTLLIYPGSGTQPELLGCMGHNEQGQFFDGLLVPLSKKDQ